MKLIPIAVLLILTTVAADEHCSTIKYQNKDYNIHIVKEGVKDVQKLALNRNDNTLYFIFDNSAAYPNRVLGYINLDSGNAGIVDGVRNASAVAIDQRNNTIYVGGADGLYIVNGNKVPEKLRIHHNINDLFFKDILYFTDRRGEAFKVINGVVEPMNELRHIIVNKLIIDEDNSILYTNQRKLYKIKLNTRIPYDNINVESITTDQYYKPYICTTNGIHVYNKYQYAMDKVSDLKSIAALTFDKEGNPIYGIVDVILKLKESPVPCFGD